MQLFWCVDIHACLYVGAQMYVCVCASMDLSWHIGEKNQLSSLVVMHNKW